MTTIVLLPGMDGTGNLFQPFVDALGHQFPTHIIRYPTDRILGYTELEDIVRSALPSEEPFILLGESFSGPIAISIAASPPSGLCGVVLCCTFMRNPRPKLAALRWLVNALPMTWIPTAAASYFLFGKYSTKALRSMLAAALTQVSVSTLHARLRSVLSVDVSRSLARFQVPMLYLRATDDRLIPTSAAAEISAAFPATTTVVIEGPHCLLQACPKPNTVQIRSTGTG